MQQLRIGSTLISMKIFALPVTIAVSFFGFSSALAETTHLLFTEQLGGVYTQDWYGRELGKRDAGFEVYVTGDGKLGDFNGVLSVDCRN